MFKRHLSWDKLGTLLVGATVVPLLMMALPVASHLGHSAYDHVDPIVKYWTVNESRIEGVDLIITGTMIKSRNGLFMPPTIARDEASGKNYAVVSASPTAGKTWAPSKYPQQFGPWRVAEAAGKTLTFFNVYQSPDGHISVVELGTHTAEEGQP